MRGAPLLSPDDARSGCGFRTRARYSTFGWVFSSSSTWNARPDACIAATAAGRVVDVAEDDRPGRAGLLAGGLDRRHPRGLPAIERRELGLVDPLDAESALLHHADAAHRDLRIERQFLHRILAASARGIAGN